MGEGWVAVFSWVYLTFGAVGGILTLAAWLWSFKKDNNEDS